MTGFTFPIKIKNKEYIMNNYDKKTEAIVREIVNKNSIFFMELLISIIGCCILKLRFAF